MKNEILIGEFWKIVGKFDLEKFVIPWKTIIKMHKELFVYTIEDSTAKLKPVKLAS